MAEVYRLADHVPKEWRRQLEAHRAAATPAKPGSTILFLAKLGRAYGWQAIQDVRHNRVSWDEVRELVAAADYLNDLERATAISDMTVAVAACFDHEANSRAQKLIKQLAREQ